MFSWKQKYPVDASHDDGSGSDASSSIQEPPSVMDEEEESVVTYYQEDNTLNNANDESTNIENDNQSNPSDEQEEDEDETWDGSETSRDSSSCCSCSPSCTRLVSSMLFVAGSALSIYSSYYTYDYYLSTDYIPTEHTFAQTVVFQANAKNEQSDVTEYMMIRCAAALCFCWMGALNLCGSDDGRFLSRLLSHGTWTVGAIWAMASAALIIKDEYLSQVFHSVSVHLYLLAALVLLCSSKQSVWRDNFHLLCCTSLRWLRLADFILVLATLCDVTLSYLYLWKEQVIGPLTQEQLLYAGMATAGGWGLCALIYFAVSFCEVCCCGRRRSASKQSPQERDEDLESAAYVYEDDEEEENDDEESQDRNNNYAPNKYMIKQEHTEDTANDDDASVSSFSSWWTAGPANKDGITRSSLDKIFGR